MADNPLTRPKAIKQSPKIWFWAFWVLVLFLVLGFLGSYYLATQTTQVKDEPAKIAQSDATFDVTLNTKQVNALVAYYLKDTHTQNYTFRVGNEIMMYGQAKFLGDTFRFGLAMSPEVTKNGNIILTAKTMRVGNLPLPIGTVMQYVKSSYHAPKFVTINQGKKQIVINMAQLDVANGLSFRAKIIDLKAGQFVFEGGLENGKK